MQTETSFVKSTHHRKLSTSFKKKLEHSTLVENSVPFHASVTSVNMPSQPLLQHFGSYLVYPVANCDEQ
jgi:hypothetical protein